ncbi:hypothetical protein LQ564_19170 [Massilia sp. G4R7]|uniref:DUF6630 domain-containing protein n=1 Tax=Massilia phyllostachyos TaxID=2898585 RepID=A0ABS8Q9J2_9BURK|nr:hypothetical protein [Massilia phyllostachyos]MCD2518426.1 hypothetical protein [Massilia phyllostachyos]
MEDARHPFHDDAVYLIDTARSSAQQPVTCYDEIDRVVHTFEDGVLEIGTDYTDYRSYHLALAGDALRVVLRIPDGERSDEYALDEDDEEDLSQRLARVARPMRLAERLERIDVAALWDETMAALFRHDPVDAAPQDAFAREDLAGAIHAVLAQSSRLAGWEWKTFGEEGVAEVNALLGAALPYASAEESRRVFRSDDFSGAVLAWFDRRLAPLGWTLAAISPFDEYQSFALLRRENAGEVRSLFEQLGVQSMAAAPAA